jgi:thiamine biosynthesis protein ThiS
MEIFLNGEARKIPDGLNIYQLVEFLQLSPHRLAIEHNLQIVKRDRWQESYLASGDRVEIVHFVGGGNVGVTTFGVRDVKSLRLQFPSYDS